MKFICPNCDQKISADDAQAGSSAQCPQCGEEFAVPLLDRRNQLRKPPADTGNPAIFVARRGRESGPFFEEQITSMQQSGMLDLEDVIWHEGLDSWIPLYRHLNLRPPVPNQEMAESADFVCVVVNRLAVRAVNRLAIPILFIIISLASLGVGGGIASICSLSPPNEDSRSLPAFYKGGLESIKAAISGRKPQDTETESYTVSVGQFTFGRDPDGRAVAFDNSSNYNTFIGSKVREAGIAFASEFRWVIFSSALLISCLASFYMKKNRVVPRSNELL